MSSMFDSRVQDRRKVTPWAQIDPERLLTHMAWNGTDDPINQQVVLTVRYRPSVASRMWWIMTWTGEDGQTHQVEAQEFDLLLWRAAEREMEAHARHQQATDPPTPPTGAG